MRVDPSQRQALESAMADHRQGRLEQAEAAYRRILEAQPENANAMHFLGLLLHSRGQSQMAIELLGNAIQLDPGNARMHNDLGGVLRLLGRLDDARRSIEQAVSLQPRFTDAHYHLGLALFSCGEVRAAAEAFRRALALEPQHAGALEGAAAAFEKLGLWQSALPHLATLAQTSGPAQAEWLNRLGICLANQLKPQQAAAAFERAIQINPGLVAAWINYSVELDHLSRRDEAIAALRKAIDLDPQSQIAHFRLAALSGDAAAVMPPQSVAAFFDDYADTFDEELVHRLKYSTPQRLYEMVSAHRPGDQFDIMDLGCGTGLVGDAFKGIAKSLAGIDLSPKMIEKSRARGIYQELICGELVAALRKRAEKFDLILAADVFIYVGNLTEVMAAVFKSLRLNGLFAFSIELLQQADGFQFRSSGRYAHSPGYIRRAAAGAGFVESDSLTAVIREQNGQPIEGMIFLCEKQ